MRVIGVGDLVQQVHACVEVRQPPFAVCFRGFGDLRLDLVIGQFGKGLAFLAGGGIDLCRHCYGSSLKGSRAPESGSL